MNLELVLPIVAGVVGLLVLGALIYAVWVSTRVLKLADRSVVYDFNKIQDLLDYTLRRSTEIAEAMAMNQIALEDTAKAFNKLIKAEDRLKSKEEQLKDSVELLEADYKGYLNLLKQVDRADAKVERAKNKLEDTKNILKNTKDELKEAKKTIKALEKENTTLKTDVVGLALTLGEPSIGEVEVVEAPKPRRGRRKKSS